MFFKITKDCAKGIHTFKEGAIGQIYPGITLEGIKHCSRVIFLNREDVMGLQIGELPAFDKYVLEDLPHEIIKEIKE